MIFVTVGACQWQFDRLLREVDRFPSEERLVVQCGPSALRPARATCIDFLSFDRLVEYIRDARVVVTHGGIGSILVALANGKHPIVVPRLRRFGEVVDDHQVDSARHLAQAGLVTCVEDPAELPAALAEAAPRGGHAPRADGGELAGEIRSYLTAIVGRAAVESAMAPE